MHSLANQPSQSNERRPGQRRRSLAPSLLCGEGVFFEEMTMEEVTQCQLRLLSMLLIQDLRKQVYLTGDQQLIAAHTMLESELVDAVERCGRNFKLVATS